MPGCKRFTRQGRLALLVLGALLATPATASEAMRILTFVPGVAHGRLPVTVDLGSSPPPADLLLDGRSACRVTVRRQTCVVDLGPSPRVSLLELVRRGAAGRELEHVRRWVNKPSTARAEVLPRTDCTRASGPCTLSVAWSHEQALDPSSLAVTVDGRKVYEGPVRDVPIPFAAGRPVRVVSADLTFVDGQKATETLLIGSGTSSAVEAPLNAVVVSVRDATASAAPAIATLGGRSVHSVEAGESEAFLVVAPSAIPKLLALEAAAQKSFTKTNARLGKLLSGISHVLHFSPLATRATYSSAATISDRLYRLQGFDCTPRAGHRDLVLPCVDQSVLGGDQYRLAATVASAAFVRAATPRRRVAVLVLGDEEGRTDESAYGAADARAYLSEILVPLEVWRVGRAQGGAWGEGRAVTTPQAFVDAWASVRAELDFQRICWVADDLDPASFRLAAADAGLVLAGRSEGAAPPSIASAAEAEEPGAAAASRPPGPQTAASRKGVAASQEVALVNLDVVVADAKGRRVTGLKASDFTLRVAGRPVSITNFSEYAPARADAEAGARPAATATGAAERPKRRVVLFVDRLTIGDRQRSARFFAALKDFVVRTIQPGDLASVLTFDEALATRVPFTGDTSAVLAALDGLAKDSSRPPAEFLGTESAERLVAEVEQAERDIAEREARLRSRGGFAEPTPPREAREPLPTPVSSTVLAEARGLAAQEWARTRRKAAALRSVLAALGGLDGRRVLVVASHRLSRWAGMEYFLTKRLDVDVQIPPEAREFDSQAILVSLAETANAYGVTLHGLYPEAGGEFDLSVVQRTTPQFTGQPMNGRRGIWIDANEADGLHLAVDDTGGSVGLGAENAADTLSGAADDLESSYSLGFPVEGLPAGRPLAVDVKVTSPGATVRTRRSVVQRTALERAADRTVATLFSRGPFPGLPLTARVTSAAPAAKGRVKVAYEVAIPAAQLALLPAPGGRVARIAALVALLDGGDVTQADPVRREFRTGEDASADASAHFTFTGEAVVAPGSTVSIGILDEATQEAGFARIDVPPRGKT